MMKLMQFIASAPTVDLAVSIAMLIVDVSARR